MRRAAMVVGAAIALVVMGIGCLAFGMIQRRIAIAQEDIAVFDFSDPQREYAALEETLERVSWLTRGLLEEIGARRAELRYWQGDYSIAQIGKGQTTPGASLGAELQLIVANALFRQAQRGPQDRTTLLKNMDAVVRAYGETVKAGNGDRTVTFNYEFVTRLRDEIGAGKRKTLPRPPTEGMSGDADMHGTPGAPPKEMQADQFKIRVPMDQKELQAIEDNQAGRGRVRQRKG